MVEHHLPILSDSKQVSFDEKCVEALQLLRDKLDFGLWMITRVEGNDWVALKTKDQEYGVQDGDVFVWMESFCSRMVAGDGPNFAPDSNKVMAYIQAEIGKKIPIQAYMGFPMWGENGELLGTLCGIDPRPVPVAWSEFEPFVHQIADELADAYRADYHETIQKGQQRLAQAKSDDQVHMLLSRDWDTLLQAYEFEAQQNHKPYSIIVAKVDAGSRKDRDVAQLFQTIVGKENYVVYQGGHLYAMLIQDCNAPKLEGLVYLIRAGMLDLGVQVFIGHGIRSDANDLIDTYEISVGHVIGQELRTRAA